MLKISIVAAFILVASCGGAPSRFQLDPDGNARVTGRVDAEMLQFFKSASPGTIKNVVITSPGGYASIASKILEYLKPGTFNITVRDYCVSACAQSLFMAANVKIIEPGSLVALHDSPIGRRTLFEVSKKTSDHTLELGAIVGENFERQKALYENRRIDLRLLQLANLRRVGTCYIGVRNPGEPDKFTLIYHNSGYAPSVQTLEAFGVTNINGSLPRSGPELEAVVQKVEIALGKPLDFSGDPAQGHVTPEDVSRELETMRVSPCTQEVVDVL